jgi:hypothetical protein
MKRLVVLSVLALFGCPKSQPPAEAEAGATVATSAAAPVVSASASASAKPAGGEASTWSAKYTLTAGTLYIPTDKDWKNAKFKNDEAKYIGDGALTLSVDKDGRVTGTSEGPPIGDAVIDGLVEDGKISANVRRKDTSDNGLTGTIVGTITGDKLEGTMKLAEANAAVVREGKITASKK